MFKLYIVFLISICVSIKANAYVFSKNASGNNLRWSTTGGAATPSMVANWNNADGLTYSSIFSLFTTSFQRWKHALTGNIDFDYVQGASYPTVYSYDGQNAIFFSSQSSQPLGSTTLGVTYVYSSNGTILEADVEFNDQNFNFTTNPSDSSQFGSGALVYLGSVATHEFGHVYGLSHSAVLQSSMVFLENRGQAKPSCDDLTAIATAYPLASFTNARGSISGKIQVTATNVFGAHVVALSKTRDTVIASALTDASGDFTISNLEPGTYYLMIEPFQGNSILNSLCGGTAAGCGYGAVNSQTVCTGSPFKRSFYEASSGVLQNISVTAGNTTAVGTITGSCNALSDGWAGAHGTTGTAPTILNSNGGSSVETAVWGVLGGVGAAQYFLLQNVDGKIEVGAHSYGIYGPLNLTVTLLDQTGTAVASGVSALGNVFSNSSSFTNYDSSVLLSNAALNNYYIRVTNSGSLVGTPALYPAGSVGYGGANPQIDSANYYLLNVRINDSTSLVPSSSSPALSNNARCENSDTFSAFTDRGETPPTTSSNGGASSSSNRSPASGGGCGTIKDHSKHDSSESARLSLTHSLFVSIWGFVFVLCFIRFVLWRPLRRH